MKDVFKIADGTTLTYDEIRSAIDESLEGMSLKKVLIIPPDFTRYHSNAGFITNYLYKKLKDSCQIDILPALGTHTKMTEEQCLEMFGEIPYEKFIYHNWRKDVVKLGEVPSDYMLEISKGLWEDPVDVEINKLVMDPSYDLIISIGQVVPHEVVGMANYSKNLFVGCGGKSMINSSHMVGAVYGMEDMMGKIDTPVRKILDYGQEHFLKDRPILFMLTVTTNSDSGILTHGLFIGPGRNTFENACRLAQKENIIFLDKGIKKCVVYLTPSEFKSTWLGNKAVYRTRMAIADDGELIILAPGIDRFGEDEGVDKLIRKYGYVGRLKVLDLFRKNQDLKDNMSAAAHLIHGSSDDRFRIYYAVKEISKEEVEGVNFIPLDYEETIKKYNPSKLKLGYNTLDDGEEIYFIPNPALGLWINKEKFED